MMSNQEELMSDVHKDAGPSVTVTWGLPDEEQQQQQQQQQRFFATTESIENQMMRLRLERESHPTKIERAIKLGQIMIRLAREGRLQELDRLLSRCPREYILTWFSVRMFKEACLHNRLQTIRFMVNNGLDVGFHAVSEAVHWVVEGSDEARDGMDVTSTLVFLAKEAGMSVNVQRKPNFFTPLHVAIQRGIFEAVRQLIDLGADINAVAKDDVMPLNLAEQDNEAGITSKAGVNPGNNNAIEGSSSCTQQVCQHVQYTEPWDARKECAEESAKKPCLNGEDIGSACSSMQRQAAVSRARICELLAERGARRTWRRPPSEKQAALDRKYATILEGDDGRCFSTFNG